MGYLILGGGAAGSAAAAAIRKRDKGGKVVVATEETAAPYLRPLLPDLVCGDVDADAIRDPQGEELAALGIEVRRGKRAVRVEAAKNKVTFADRTSETYQVLLVATGGKPAVPPALAASRTAVSFDSLADTVRIRERSQRPGASVVYGPGYLAMEACRVLRKAGRAYVQAYVPYLHFVERLYANATTPIVHGGGEGGHEAPGHAEAGGEAEHAH